jgi:hypothetical protein
LVSTVTPRDEEAVVLEDVGIDHRWRRRALGGCFRLDRKADTYSQGDGYGYFNSQDDGYGNTNPPGDGYANANSQDDGYANANPQADGYGNANRQGDGNPQAGHARADGYPRADTEADRPHPDGAAAGSSSGSPTVPEHAGLFAAGSH